MNSKRNIGNTNYEKMISIFLKTWNIIFLNKEFKGKISKLSYMYNFLNVSIISSILIFYLKIEVSVIFSQKKKSK